MLESEASRAWTSCSTGNWSTASYNEGHLEFPWVPRAIGQSAISMPLRFLSQFQLACLDLASLWASNPDQIFLQRKIVNWKDLLMQSIMIHLHFALSDVWQFEETGLYIHQDWSLWFPLLWGELTKLLGALQSHCQVSMTGERWQDAIIFSRWKMNADHDCTMHQNSEQMSKIRRCARSNTSLAGS